jgi:hypothetical protein
MDRGNLADLTAAVRADRASFVFEGTSLQWVTLGHRNLSDERPFHPGEQPFSATPTCLFGTTSGHGKIHGRTATVPWSAKFTSAMKDVAITFW